MLETTHNTLIVFAFSMFISAIFLYFIEYMHGIVNKAFELFLYKCILSGFAGLLFIILAVVGTVHVTCQDRITQANVSGATTTYGHSFACKQEWVEPDNAQIYLFGGLGVFCIVMAVFWALKSWATSW